MKEPVAVGVEWRSKNEQRDKAEGANGERNRARGKSRPTDTGEKARERQMERGGCPNEWSNVI